MSHPTNTLLGLPFDVRLQITIHLAVTDLLCLLATCTIFRKLQDQRAAWRNAIWMMEVEEFHPIAAHNLKLEDMDVVELKASVLRARRLLRIRDGSIPRPRLIRIGRAREDNTIAPHWQGAIYFLPGTYLVVVEWPDHISCWDILAERVVGKVQKEGISLSNSTPVARAGDRFLVAGYIPIAHGCQLEQLAVLSIDITQRDSTGVVIRVDRSAVIPAPNRD